LGQKNNGFDNDALTVQIFIEYRAGKVFSPLFLSQFTIILSW